jgi:phosphatidylinositol phospholipase C gamma-1
MNLVPEAEQLINQLERGTVVTKFFFRKRAERRTLAVRRETRQIVWHRTNNNANSGGGGGAVGSAGGGGGAIGNSSAGSNSLRTLCEGTVDIREIKLIRPGKSSKDFEKWADDAKRYDAGKCFVIFFGSEFRLRTLSIAALSEKEADLWVRGLNFLFGEMQRTPYPLQLMMWLRKEFYGMENTKGHITLKELKTFLPKVNCKMSTTRLREIFHSVDTKSGEIGFDDFVTLFHDKLVFDRSPFDEYLAKYSSMEKDKVSFQEFKVFLEEEQKEGNVDVISIIREYLPDPVRDVEQPFLYVSEVSWSMGMK